MSARLNSLLNQAWKYDGGRNQVGNLARLQMSPKSGSPSITPKVANGDSLSLSDTLKTLKDMGVDLDESSFAEVNQSLNFNLQFSDTEIEGFTSTGSYDLHSQSLQVDLSFSAAMSVTDAETGAVRKELFQFEFHMEATQTQIAMGDQKAGKDDILQFARNMLEKLSKLYSEGKNIDGLKLSGDDLKEFGSEDGAKLLKGIKKIIDLLRKTDHAHGRGGYHGWSRPATGEAQALTGTQMETQSLKMSLDVRRVSVVLNTAETGTSQTENATAQSSADQQPVDSVAGAGA